MSSFLDDDSSDDDSWVLEHPGLFSAKKMVPLSQRLAESSGSDSSDDDTTPIAAKVAIKSRRIISIDSSDDETVCSHEETTKEVPIDLTLETPTKEETIDLTKQMEDLNMNADDDDDAWAYDKVTDEYFLSTANFDIAGVVWPEFRIPSDLYNSLYPHQKVGVQWMASLHSNKIGGILADDMGLGKTWQTLTYLGGLMKADTIASALVIAPVSILRSWEKEAQKVIQRSCVPHLDIRIVSSSMRRVDRQRILRAAILGDHHRKGSKCLIITTYGLVSNDPQDFVVGEKGFDYVALDEGHKIKNASANVSKSCHRLCRFDNTRRLLLSGTPIQNNLKEMWALFDFATSGRIFGPLKRFKMNFADPIELGRSKYATESTMNAAERANAKLQAKLKPHFLQRMKKDILTNMPSKKDLVVWTHLSAKQRRLYEEYVSGSETVKSVLSGEKRSPLEAVTWLKKLAGHPLLVDEKYDREMSTLRRLGAAKLINESAKLEVLAGLVEKLSISGHRTLIFSGSTMTLDIIERVLEGLNLSRIDGSTKEVDRQRQVEEFNREDSTVDVMLLSTKAGGLGITLTGADRAIIYDPSWNPTDDSQAVDRCYRIGQKRPVEVYRLIAAGTVEEKMYEKQIFKDGLRRVVTTNASSNTHRYFDKNELSKLFNLAPKGACGVLQKLGAQGRVGEVETSTQKSFFDRHEGVIGLSSHDAVYKEIEAAPGESITPFASLKKDFKVVGKAQRALVKERKMMQKKLFEKTESTPPKPQTVTTPSASKFFSPSRFDTVKRVVESLQKKGRNEDAMRYLLDLLENEQERLEGPRRLWMHKQIAVTGSTLGWIS